MDVLSPHIFKNVIDLKPFYHEVMQGKVYAVFDEVTSELIPSIRENENAGTGFVFFMKQFPKLVFQKHLLLQEIIKSKLLSYVKKMELPLLIKCLCLQLESEMQKKSVVEYRLKKLIKI